jgi:hypothetical protein
LRRTNSVLEVWLRPWPRRYRGGWANSSNIGVHHPLYRHVAEYFMDADAAKARLKRLADPAAENIVLRDKAKRLLTEWDDKVFN